MTEKPLLQLILIVILVIQLFLAVALRGYLILRLQAVSMAIASGKLDQRLEINHINELENLAQSFNHMAAYLAVSFLKLETIVEKCTAAFKASEKITEHANDKKSLSS